MDTFRHKIQIDLNEISLLQTPSYTYDTKCISLHIFFFFKMNYQLLKEVLDLVEEFEHQNSKNTYNNDVEGFKQWIAVTNTPDVDQLPIKWEGKDKGRSAESIISTLLVHMNRFAKNYSKAAMKHSEFSTQDEFIYLINLRAFGEMTKMDLIKKNRHDKPAGMQIINRLIHQGWVVQTDSEKDRRSKLISITTRGIETLEANMDKIRQATAIICGNLNNNEKNQLIYLLQKLENFHVSIYEKDLDKENLLDYILKKNQ